MAISHYRFMSIYYNSYRKSLYNYSFTVEIYEYLDNMPDLNYDLKHTY